MDDDFGPIDRERLAKALQTVPLADFLESRDLEDLADAIAAAYASVVDEPIVLPPVVGAVGTLTGPPIMGTRDNVNAGPARPLQKRAREGDVILPGLARSPQPHAPWKPAGEVGVITGAGTSVVEEPKNDARPVIKRVGPGV